MSSMRKMFGVAGLRDIAFGSEVIPESSIAKVLERKHYNYQKAIYSYQIMRHLYRNAVIVGKKTWKGISMFSRIL